MLTKFVHERGHFIEIAFVADASSDHAPAGSVVVVDFIYLEREKGLGHRGALASARDPEEDAVTRNGVVRGFCHWSKFIVEDEPADFLAF